MEKEELPKVEVQTTEITTSNEESVKNSCDKETPKDDDVAEQNEGQDQAPAETLESEITKEAEKSFQSHPYKTRLLNFEPTVEQMSRVENIEPPKTLKETPLCDIVTKDNLQELITDLKSHKVIGVDVEYSDHGYVALTCLVQISTSNKDYLIDAITLKDELHKLNEIFTNPDVVKIFHAAGNDLRWLQRDLGVFVINMFDTQIAMRALGYNKLGLDALLQVYNATKDKAMQRADFRRRPLPPKFKDYARLDSHYLITFYHKLKNELIDAKLLKDVYDNCNNCCKILYPKVEDESYLSVLRNVEEMHKRQLLVLEKLNDWRHRIAQYLDINVGCVLSKNKLETLVLQMPTDSSQIIKISESRHVKEHLGEVIQILSEGNPVNRINTFSRNKRKFSQTDFGRNEPSGSYKKKWNKHPVDKNVQNFDLRNTLPQRGRNAYSNKRGAKGFQKYN
ncbi:exosome complex exonuclease RRP6-like [Tribolium madens]|uniref:exosome complex exonuclease RRP6-like n=1 Tax=Tribolium madens TaxID=41895 RepID=UPI001CF74FDD|nr:exosome complex exonuclease RRP6-like [Tribolium madens]